MTAFKIFADLEDCSEIGNRYQLRVPTYQVDRARLNEEVLRRAVTAAPPGVFVDFDAEADRYGRSGIGYRELRPEHEITWTVLADDELRIGIGCQSPPGSAAAIAAACETAVRTAHGVR